MAHVRLSRPAEYRARLKRRGHRIRSSSPPWLSTLRPRWRMLAHRHRLLAARCRRLGLLGCRQGIRHPPADLRRWAVRPGHHRLQDPAAHHGHRRSHHPSRQARPECPGLLAPERRRHHLAWDAQPADRRRLLDLRLLPHRLLAVATIRRPPRRKPVEASADRPRPHRLPVVATSSRLLKPHPRRLHLAEGSLPAAATAWCSTIAGSVTR